MKISLLHTSTAKRIHILVVLATSPHLRGPHTGHSRAESPPAPLPHHRLHSGLMNCSSVCLMSLFSPTWLYSTWTVQENPLPLLACQQQISRIACSLIDRIHSPPPDRLPWSNSSKTNSPVSDYHAIWSNQFILSVINPNLSIYNSSS